MAHRTRSSYHPQPPIYPYQSEMVHETSGDVLTLYSKYPIISTERIPFDSEVNLSVAYRIKVGKDTVLSGEQSPRIEPT